MGTLAWWGQISVLYSVYGYKMSPQELHSYAQLVPIIIKISVWGEGWVGGCVCGGMCVYVVSVGVYSFSPTNVDFESSLV